ncbi:AI-2E family transporter [Microbacterium album]|uniref:AI-2E family transporter n=1 Tax=Microbacterium album TaxID=2053191 RepID=A0A917IG82_9MICO|nr:AI-2E family transporter [Microbacterium album]GGH46809.1 AI-2E family transporter [Microbacterium album]
MLWRRRAPQVRVEAPAQPTPPPAARTLWTDSLGTLATRAIQIIAVVVLAAGVIWGLRNLTLVVIPVLLALIFASAFEPVMSRLRSRLPAVLATIIVLLAIVLALGAVGWLIVWAVRDQWDELYTQAQDGVMQVLEWVNTLPFAPTQEQIDEWLGALTDFLTSAQFGSGAVAGVSAVASFVTGFVLMVVVLFFFLKDGPAIWEFLRRPFTGEWYDRATRAGRKTVDTLGSYVRGTATVAAVDAIGIGIGLWILQVPLWPALAVLVFLLAFIPIVGATLAGTLAALVALVASGPVIALVVVGIVIAVNQLEGNLLQPVVMGRALKLNALVVLIALTIGTVLSGVIGAVLAVPLTAVAWGIVQVWDGPDRPARWARRKDSARA